MVRVGENWCAAHCLDQSPGGMRFQTDAKLTFEPGDLVEIVSLEPDLSFEGRVAWVQGGQVGVEREETVIFSLERRRYVRVNAADLTASAGLQALKVLDVSLRGLRVEAPEKLTPGTIEVDLHLPEASLRLSAVVLESRGSVARLELTDVSGDAHDRLAAYLASALRNLS